MSNMIVNYPKLSHEQVLALEPHYSRHVAAMTEEGLYGKAEIAEQLALRDRKLELLDQSIGKQDESFKKGTMQLQSFADIYGKALQSFRDLDVVRGQFASKLKEGGELGPLSDEVQEKAEVAFRALKAADETFKRANDAEPPHKLPCEVTLEAAQRRVAALEYTLGLKAGETIGLTAEGMTKGLHDLESLFKEAVAKVDAMSPEERETTYRQQRESWARGQVGLIDSDREYSKSRGIDGD